MNSKTSLFNEIKSNNLNKADVEMLKIITETVTKNILLATNASIKGEWIKGYGQY